MAAMRDLVCVADVRMEMNVRFTVLCGDVTGDGYKFVVAGEFSGVILLGISVEESDGDFVDGANAEDEACGEVFFFAECFESGDDFFAFVDADGDFVFKPLGLHAQVQAAGV